MIGQMLRNISLEHRLISRKSKFQVGNLNKESDVALLRNRLNVSKIPSRKKIGCMWIDRREKLTREDAVKHRSKYYEDN